MALSAGLAADVQGVVDRLRALWLGILPCYDDPGGCGVPEILFFPFAENAGALFRSVTRLEAIDDAFLALLEVPLVVECLEYRLRDLRSYTEAEVLCWLLTEAEKTERVLPRRDNARDNDIWLNDLSDLLTVLETLRYDGPSSCPCEPWPPEEWPCGGLNQTYLVSNGLVSPYDEALCYRHFDDGEGGWGEMRLKAPQTVTAASSCRWSGGAQYPLNIQRRGNTNLKWTDYVGKPITLFLSKCRWQVTIGAYISRCLLHASLPVGNYWGFGGQVGDDLYTYSVEVS